MLKLGLSELRAAFYPGSNIAQPTEYGVFGKETPGEVADMREGDRVRDEERSVLGEKLEAAEAKRDLAAREQGRERDKEPERDSR
jgi:hypothetical protein